MTRRVRLAARYAVDLSVSLQGASWTQPTVVRARDLSRGGLFVASEQAPEIFSELRAAISLPSGGELVVQARVVHIMPVEKARELGIEAGLGLEFLDLTVAQKEGVEQLVKWARDSDPKRRVPKRTARAPASDLNPMLGYVLSAIDGSRSSDDIAERLELELESTETVLSELEQLGLIQIQQGGAAAAAPALSAPSSRRAPAASAVLEVGSTGALSEDEKRAIETLHGRLAGDHYQVLAVLPTADREQIRSAYFTLSKQFHPDAFQGRVLAEHQAKLFEIFDRLTEAYAALSTPSARKQYDDYLRAAVVPVAAPVMPAAPRVAPAANKPASEISRVPATVRYDTAQASRVPLAGAKARVQPASGSTGVRAAGATEAGPVDLVRSYLEQAIKAFKAGDLKGAARFLDLLEALEWNRPDLRSAYEELESKVTLGLVDTYTQQARYEVKHQRWRQAARSWMKVCRARPNDVECHSGAAEALLRAKSELRKARDLAQRAVELAPKDARARRILGHVYLEAGLHLNARRELEAAASLNRNDADTQELLQRVGKV